VGNRLTAKVLQRFFRTIMGVSYAESTRHTICAIPSTAVCGLAISGERPIVTAGQARKTHFARTSLQTKLVHPKDVQAANNLYLEDVCETYCYFQ
jgi:hypothetical protein